MKKSVLFLAALMCMMMSSVSTFAHDVPAPIANYVKTHFAGATVVMIDKERYGYDVELSNDLKLKFNKKGQLINIDD